MLKLTKQNIIALSVFVVVLIGCIYFFFIRTSVPIVIDDSSNVVGQDIIQLVDKFESVSIDTSLFSSSLFTHLKDTSASITSEPLGRSNPFALIGVENPNSNSTKSQSSSASKTSTTAPPPVVNRMVIPGL